MIDNLKIKFLGATEGVGGSCNLIEYKANGEKYKMLVDAGIDMEKEIQKLHFTPSEIDIVFLTHAHLDHTGLIPLMMVKGFRGKIKCTKATGELTIKMLEDYMKNEKDFNYYSIDYFKFNNFCPALPFRRLPGRNARQLPARAANSNF